MSLKAFIIGLLLAGTAFAQTHKFPYEDSGLDAGKPAPGSCVAPYFYQATDTNLLYFCNGSTGNMVPSASGGGIAGSGTSGQFVLWSAANAVTGFSDFTWTDSTQAQVEIGSGAGLPGALLLVRNNSQGGALTDVEVPQSATGDGGWFSPVGGTLAVGQSSVGGNLGLTYGSQVANQTITSVSRTSNVVTLTYTVGGSLTNPFIIGTGDRIKVVGVTDSSYNGTFQVQSVVPGVSSGTLTYNQTGSNSSSSGGIVSLPTAAGVSVTQGFGGRELMFVAGGTMAPFADSHSEPGILFKVLGTNTQSTAAGDIDFVAGNSVDTGSDATEPAGNINIQAGTAFGGNNSGGTVFIGAGKGSGTGTNGIVNVNSGQTTMLGNVCQSGPRPAIDITCFPYSADFTGTNDATAAFTLADTNCAGGTVLVPPGTYKLSTWTPTTSCNFVTDGHYNSVHLLRNSGTAGGNRQVGWVVIEASQFTIDGFLFDGNVGGGMTGNCVLIEGPIADVGFTHNVIKNCDSTGLTLTATAVGGVGPSSVEIAWNKIAAGTNAANAQGAIYGEDTLDDINIHDNPLIDGTACNPCSTINFLSGGLTTTFNDIHIINNPSVLCPGAVINDSGWCIQAGGFNAFAVEAIKAQGNSFELTNTSAGFISIPIAIDSKIISGNHMNSHYMDLMRCGATTSSACTNDGVSNGTSTWTSATGTFTSADTGRTLIYVCSGTTYKTLVTFSNSTTLTLSTAAVCTGSSEVWQLFGYSINFDAIEGGGSTGTVIDHNVCYCEGSQQMSAIALDGTSGAVVNNNEIRGMGEQSSNGITFVAATVPQYIASLSQAANIVNLATSGSLNATWQPSTTAAFFNCQLTTCRTGTDGTTSASTTFTSATAAFTTADVNRAIIVYGCIATGSGNPNGALLNTIASVSNATTVSLFTACTQTQSGTATWQIFTAPPYLAAFINQNYSRTGGTISFLDPTSGITCSSNCGMMVQAVSNNQIANNTIWMPLLAATGNTVALNAHSQTTNIEYAYGNSFIANTVIGNSGQSGNGFCIGNTGSQPIVDSTIFMFNRCINVANGISRGNGTNTTYRDNFMTNVASPWSGSKLAGEIIDFVGTYTSAQLSGAGFGTGPSVPFCGLVQGCVATTRAINITVGTSPSTGGGVISGLQAAPTGWTCTALNDTSRTGISIRFNGSTTTSVTWTFDNAPSATDILSGTCSPY